MLYHYDSYSKNKREHKYKDTDNDKDKESERISETLVALITLHPDHPGHPGYPHHLSYPSPMQGSDMPSTTWSSFLSLQWLDPDAFIRWLVVPASVGSLIGPSLMMGRLNQQWGRQ